MEKVETELCIKLFSQDDNLASHVMCVNSIHKWPSDLGAIISLRGNVRFESLCVAFSVRTS